MLKYLIFVIIVGGLGYVWVTRDQSQPIIPAPRAVETTIRYVAVGDGYVLGQGVSPLQSWPAQLTSQLTKRQVEVELVKVAAHPEWTTLQVLENGILMVKEADPDVVTLQIGVNDWIQGIDNATFSERFERILVELQKIVPANKIVILTIPNISVTPNAALYANGRDLKAGIEAFNEIILNTAESMDITTVDIFTLSSEMADPLYVSYDGFYPSDKENLRWVEGIYPYVRRVISE